jgi:hypothetical protein
MPTIYLNKKAKDILENFKRPGQSWSGVIVEHLGNEGGSSNGKGEK